MDNQTDKEIFKISEYIDDIKKDAYKDIAHIQNNVLNKNPYTSNFFENYLSKKNIKKKNFLFIIKQIFLYYVKNLGLFCSCISCFIIFKLYGKKNGTNIKNNTYLVDIFFRANKIIQSNKFEDKFFFPGVYDYFIKSNRDFIFIPRIIDTEKNPLKFFKLIKILKKDNKNKYLLDYELLNISDFLKLFTFVLNYPFKQFKLIQNESTYLDISFNYELFECLPNTSFEGYMRYLFGKKISLNSSRNLIIFSWQEFQNLEKCFNRAIHESQNNILIYGCEFSIKYKNYLSMHITNVDVDLKVSPHQTLLNGTHNYSISTKHLFKEGVSLRYKNIFRDFNYNCTDESFLALLSWDIEESNSLLHKVKAIEDLTVKLHPVTETKHFDLNKMAKWSYTDDDLYTLFEKTSIVLVPPMTGTALEAVASGVSVLIVATDNKFEVTPLVQYGQNKIWDVVYRQNELSEKINSLMDFRKKNMSEIVIISEWYRDNFFIEPNEENIKKAFDL